MSLVKYKQAIDIFSEACAIKTNVLTYMFSIGCFFFRINRFVSIQYYMECERQSYPIIGIVWHFLLTSLSFT